MPEGLKVPNITWKGLKLWDLKTKSWIQQVWYVKFHVNPFKEISFSITKEARTIFAVKYGAKYSRVDQVKFLEDSF